jgi:hypothetical protein
MKIMMLLGLLGLMSTGSPAAEPPPLQAIMKRYDQTRLNQDESLREKYIMELAVLRWHLARHNQPGWEAVEAEMVRHPAPADSNTNVFFQRRLGMWYSPRHDYLFRSDGTWIMNYPDVSNPTHGTWAIQGNRYFDSSGDDPKSSTPFIIYLLTQDYFFYGGGPGSGGEIGTGIYFERRSPHGGLPLRADDPAP